MGFFSGYKNKTISNTIHIKSDPETIWNEITNVMVNKLRFPVLLSLLGIPKPEAAQVIKEGVGGYRVAHFSNAATFQQVILEWELYKKYRFDFNASDNFRVGHIMNLSRGPFEIRTGGYELIPDEEGVTLILASDYRLHGMIGYFFHLPFRMVVYWFQRYLLRAIRVNCK